MRVFVTGGTGYIGGAVVRALLRAGHEVTGLVRSLAKADLLEAWGARVLEGDLARPETFAAEAARHEACIHAALDPVGDMPAVDRGAVAALLEAGGRIGVLRVLVYTSGVWVLGDTGDIPADEKVRVSPPPLVAWRPGVEEMVLGASGGRLATVVVRPGIVYGGSGGILGLAFKTAEVEGAVRYMGEGRNRWALVHIADLADLYRRIVERAPSGEIYYATDGSAHPVRSIAEAVAEATQALKGAVSWPQVIARGALGPIAEGLALDQVVSSAKAERDLGWLPRYRSFVARRRELYDEWRRR